jgi:hypothetical protein
VGGGAWPFLVGGAICLVNSDNERDSVLLTRRVNPARRAGRARFRPRVGRSGGSARYPRTRSPVVHGGRPGAVAPSASRRSRVRGARVCASGVSAPARARARRGLRPSGSAVKRAASAAVAGGSRYVTRATAGSQELKLFLEGQAADENSRTRLSDNRSVMPLDVLGRTRATLKESACVNVPGPTGFRVTR